MALKLLFGLIASILVFNALTNSPAMAVTEHFEPDQRLTDYVTLFSDQGIDHFGLRNLIQPEAVKEIAVNLTVNLDSDLEKVKAVHSFIKESIRYKPQYSLINTSQILLNGWGDCSEMSLLAISILESLGFESYITNGQGHVFVITLVSDSWIVIDPTMDFQESQLAWINYLVEWPFLVNSTNTLIASCPTTNVFV